ncbi:Succinate dehydrogenase assembly factor 3, mitochondrial [Lachnellula subtilissima]|uniref:Succinate dehydrogenase assembly factor 3 n=1 Tax=Lachnellula subtilissima TaxID=602034 RepID=A0A8H8S209_9HELO|nr:Succinate dehydrogenase assembly factor 3, mitochondrial [Lachnellula subtilissima]
MRINPRLLMATVTSAGTKKGFRPAPMALLPPIPLYRRLLRSHRKHLPREMRLLGDEYIKSEFRAHRDVENPVHIIGFLTEWQLYAQKLEGESWIGERMDAGKIEKMSGAHLNKGILIGQFYELMQAVKKSSGENDTEQ